MSGTWRILAALLPFCLASNVAVAAERLNEHPSKNAQRTLIVLAAVGVENSDVKALVGEIDARVDDNGYFYLSEESVNGGKLRLHVLLKDQSNNANTAAGGGLNRLELRYTPEHSNFTAAARPDRLMINYRLKF